MVSSEAVPFAKTGGLADVLGALPQALVRQGAECGVVIPRYASIPLDNATRIWDSLPVFLNSYRYDTSVWETLREGVPYYLVDCPALYGRAGIYGDRYGEFGDNHIRYAVLSQAALGIARSIFRPHVLHCHDWQAGLVPLFLKNYYAGDPTFEGVRTLLTIHNLGYQGLFTQAQLWECGLNPNYWRSDLVEFYGMGSMLKAGIAFSDALSTVSPKYAQEIQTPEYGFRMDGILRSRASVLTGILNGVDYAEWSPEIDKFIVANYSAEDLDGKQLCKMDLLEQFGFAAETADRPLIGIVSRFAYQKGFDLIAQVFEELLAEDITVIALGSGEAEYENMFRALEYRHRDKLRAWIGYSDEIAHKIEAGADMFLMPSRYEPCGLNQIYSLKYGTLPIVRATGGLDDTIDGETGFKFWGFSGYDMLAGIRYALEAYGDAARWRQMMATAMSRDFSWDKSAADYLDLYRRL